MIKLRTILLCNFFYYLILILVLILTFLRLKVPFESHYHEKQKQFKGTILSVKVEGDLLKFVLEDENSERVSTSYYFQTKHEKEKFASYFKLGDTVEVKGKFSKILKNTTKNLFNYQEYAFRKRMVYTVQVESIMKVADYQGVLFSLKNFMNVYFESFQDGGYLKLILLGNKEEISKEMIDSFRDNGISHLFAISGMHVGLFASIILNIFSIFKMGESKRYFLTCVFLLCYLLLVGCSPSIVRAFLFFLLLTINRVYYFHINSKNIFFLTLAITLCIDPYFIYDIGFQYSFLISFALISCNELLNRLSYFSSLMATSIISFCISVPITTYHFYQINLLSIIYNLFYVPFVTFLLFPFSLLLLFCPFLEFLYHFLIILLEKSSLFLSHIGYFKLIFGRVCIFYYGLYILMFFLFTRYKRKIFLLCFFFFLVFHYFIYSIFDHSYLTMLDVGQGDSFIFHSKGKTILIDTGGKINYYQASWRKRKTTSIVLNTTIPYLKSKGIKKLDYLVLTHGDYDHLGEALTLLKNYSVDQIFINEGKQNSLEKKISKIFSNVSICYEGKYFEVGDFQFLSINHDLLDENSSSIVLYIMYHNYKMLFMGDANFKSERFLLDTYDLDKVNLLKLGHHGSKTSTSEEFLEKIRPDFALISAGRNNKFNHPSQETLKRLQKYQVKSYSTQKDGTIEFDFTFKKILT